MKSSSRSWPSVTVPQYAKPFKILVWKNGDFDSNEQEVTINPKYVKSWTATLSYLTLVLQPSFGAVRKLYDLQSKKMVDCQKCLNADDRYIAVGGEQFKYRKNAYLTGKERLNQHVVNKSTNKQYEDMDDILNFMTSTKKKKRTVVYVMVSGRKYQVPLKTVLTPEDKGSWKIVLDYLAYLLDVPEGIQHLCTTKGKIVTNPEKLRHGNVYIAVPFVSSFSKMDYRKVFDDYKQGRMSDSICDKMPEKKLKGKGKKKYDSMSPSLRGLKGSTPNLQYGKCISVKCSVTECKLFNNFSDNESSTYRSDKGLTSVTETEMATEPSTKSLHDKESVHETHVEAATTPPVAECCRSKMTTFAEIAKSKEKQESSKEAFLQDNSDADIRKSVTFRSSELAQVATIEEPLPKNDALLPINDIPISPILKASDFETEPIPPRPQDHLTEEGSDASSEEARTQAVFEALKRTTSFSKKPRDSITVNAARLSKMIIKSNSDDATEPRSSNDKAVQEVEQKDNSSSNSKLNYDDIYLNFDLRASTFDHPKESYKLEEGKQEEQKKACWRENQQQTDKQETKNFQVINLQEEHLSNMDLNNKNEAKCSKISFNFKTNIIETHHEYSPNESLDKSEESNNSNDHRKIGINTKDTNNENNYNENLNGSTDTDSTNTEVTHNENSSNECLIGSEDNDDTNSEVTHNENYSNECLNGSEKNIGINESLDSLEKTSTNNNNKTQNVTSNQSLDSLEDNIISTTDSDNKHNMDTHGLFDSVEKNTTNNDSAKNIGTNESMDSLEETTIITNSKSQNIGISESRNSLEKTTTTPGRFPFLGMANYCGMFLQPAELNSQNRNRSLNQENRVEPGIHPDSLDNSNNLKKQMSLEDSLRKLDIILNDKKKSLEGTIIITNIKNENVGTNESLDSLEKTTSSFSNNANENLKKISLDSLEENLSNNGESKNQSNISNMYAYVQSINSIETNLSNVSESRNQGNIYAGVQGNTRQHNTHDNDDTDKENNGNGKLDNSTSIKNVEENNSITDRNQDHQISPTHSFSSDSLEEEQNVVNTYYLISYSNINEKTLIFNNNTGRIKGKTDKSGTDYTSFYLNQKETKSKTIFHRKKNGSDLEENQIQRSGKVQADFNAYINNNFRNTYLNRKNNLKYNTQHDFFNKNQNPKIITSNNYYSTIKYQETPSSSLNVDSLDGWYNIIKPLRSTKEKNYKSNKISNKHNLVLNNVKKPNSFLNRFIKKRNYGANHKNLQTEELNYKDFLIILKMQINNRKNSNNDINDRCRGNIIRIEENEKLRLDSLDNSNVSGKPLNVEESLDTIDKNTNDHNQESLTNDNNVIQVDCCGNVLQPTDLNRQYSLDNSNVSEKPLNVEKNVDNFDRNTNDTNKELTTNDNNITKVDCCGSFLQPTDIKSHYSPDNLNVLKKQLNVDKNKYDNQELTTNDNNITKVDCCGGVLPPTDLNSRNSPDNSNVVKKTLSVDTNQQLLEKKSCCTNTYDNNQQLTTKENNITKVDCCESFLQLTDLNSLDNLNALKKSINGEKRLDNFDRNKNNNNQYITTNDNNITNVDCCGNFPQSTDLSHYDNISSNQGDRDITQIAKKKNHFSFLGMENYCGIFLQPSDLNGQNKKLSLYKENKVEPGINSGSLKKQLSFEDTLENLDKTTTNKEKKSSHIFMGPEECCRHIIVSDQVGQPKSIDDQNGNIPEDNAPFLKNFETKQKEPKSDSSFDSLKENLYDSHSDSREKSESIEHLRTKSNILKIQINNKIINMEKNQSEQCKDTNTLGRCSDFCLRCNPNPKRKCRRETSAAFACSNFTIKCEGGQYNDDLKNNGVFIGCSDICIKCPKD